MNSARIPCSIRSPIGRSTWSLCRQLEAIRASPPGAGGSTAQTRSAVRNAMSSGNRNKPPQRHLQLHHRPLHRQRARRAGNCDARSYAAFAKMKATSSTATEARSSRFLQLLLLLHRLLLHRRVAIYAMQLRRRLRGSSCRGNRSASGATGLKRCCPAAATSSRLSRSRSGRPSAMSRAATTAAVGLRQVSHSGRAGKSARPASSNTSSSASQLDDVMQRTVIASRSTWARRIACCTIGAVILLV